MILKTKHGLFLHYLQDQKEIKLDGFNDFTKLGKDYLVVMTPEKQWGVIDINGNIAIDCQFKEARDFNASGCAFVKNEDIWQLVRLYSKNYES